MTRDEFIDKFRHEIGGMVLDAATAHRTGAELAVSIRFVMKKIDATLGAAFDSLAPAPKQPAPERNGTPAAQPQVKK